MDAEREVEVGTTREIGCNASFAPFLEAGLEVVDVSDVHKRHLCGMTVFEYSTDVPPGAVSEYCDLLEGLERVLAQEGVSDKAFLNLLKGNGKHDLVQSLQAGLQARWTSIVEERSGGDSGGQWEVVDQALEDRPEDKETEWIY